MKSKMWYCQENIEEKANLLAYTFKQCLKTQLKNRIVNQKLIVISENIQKITRKNIKQEDVQPGSK